MTTGTIHRCFLSEEVQGKGLIPVDTIDILPLPEMSVQRGSDQRTRLLPVRCSHIECGSNSVE
jgi:hypothetical protein